MRAHRLRALWPALVLLAAAVVTVLPQSTAQAIPFILSGHGLLVSHALFLIGKLMSRKTLILSSRLIPTVQLPDRN